MDDFKDLGFEEDFDSLGFEPEVKPEKEISLVDTLRKGIDQGGTLGLSDEISGAMQAGIDLGQSALHNIGLARPSPTQVSAELAQQGFTGDLGPTSTGKMYKQARDEERQAIAEAAEANPKTFMAGNILGGIVTAPIMPTTSFSSPLLNTLATGAGYGAAAGYGSSAEEGLGGQAMDALTGAALGAGAGAAMHGLATAAPVVGKAISNKTKGITDAVKSKFPTLSEAYSEPLNISSPEYQQAVVSRQQKTFEPLAKAEVSKRQNTLMSLEQKSNDLNAKIQKTQDDIAQRILKQEQNIDLGEQSNAKALAENADKIQNNLVKYKDQVKNNFNKIDDLVKDSNTTINIDKELSDLHSNLIGNGVPEEQAAAVVKGLQNKFGSNVTKQLDPITLQPMESKGLSLASFRNLRESISDLSSNPTLIRPLKNFYAATASKRVDSLAKNGLQDVADQLSKNDAAYSNIMNIEADHLGDLSNSASKIIQAYKASGNPYDPAAINNIKEFKKLLPKLPESIRGDLESSLADAEARFSEMRKYKSGLGSKTDMLTEAGVPELKTQAREIESQINPLQKQLANPEKLQQDLMSELISGAKTMDLPPTDARRIKYENLLQEYQKMTGKDITQDVQKLNIQNKIMGKQTPSFESAVENLDLNRPVKSVAPTLPKAANMMGRAVRKITGADRVVKATDEQLGNLVNNLKNFNSPELDHAAEVISKSQGKTGASRVAPIFSALQGSPELRKMMNKDNKK